jgi:hypothetical protein
MWDLWWKKRQWSRFLSSTSISLATYSTDCSTLIAIYHLELAQEAK